METAVISIVMIGLLVFGAMTLSQGFLSSLDKTSQAWDEMGKNSENTMRTVLSTISAAQTAADTLEFTVKNDGETKVAEYAKWDFIVEYYDGSGGYHVQWLPYASAAPAANQWTNKGIYLDAGAETPEVFDPGILNPREEIVLEAKLDPPAGAGTTNRAVVSTPNGVRAATTFIGF